MAFVMILDVDASSMAGVLSGN